MSRRHAIGFGFSVYMGTRRGWAMDYKAIRNLATMFFEQADKLEPILKQQQSADQLKNLRGKAGPVLSWINRFNQKVRTKTHR